MKVVILAGGFGTRLSEYTESIPKPMVTVGGLPMIWHIMRRYASYGHKDFYLALGYKASLVKQYFQSMRFVNYDFTIDLSNGSLAVHDGTSIDWKVTLVDTGLNTMTGGRVKRLQSYIGDEPFMLTYGDGVADINFDELLNFHQKSHKLATITAVRPIARFGELAIDGDLVTSFKEKPQVTRGWINGGFFVCQPEVMKFIDGDSTVWEKEPLEEIASNKQLASYKHTGFWQCMDTKRDRDYLEKLFNSQKNLW